MISSRNVFLAFSIGLICAGALPRAQAATTSVSGSEMVLLPLVATGHRAKIGRAVLVPEGDKTVVRLELSGVPDYTTRPIHFYTYIYDGACGGRSAAARYALNDHVLANSFFVRPRTIGAFNGPVWLEESIPVDFQTLRATHYAISVRTGPADGGKEIYCGDNSH